VRDGVLDAGSLASLPNRSAPSFTALIQTYLAGRCEGVGSAIIALAAPADGDVIALTNIDWSIDRCALKAALGIEDVRFLNDLMAIGYALGKPDNVRATEIAPGQRCATGNQLVIGVGTGFNCAARLSDGSVVTCEAGHATFAAVTDFDFEMQSLMSEKYGRCSNERLLSGSGFVEVYRALSGIESEPVDGRAILESGIDGSNPAAAQACVEFTRMMGQAAGDLSLLFWATGGVWLNGGPARALSPLLTQPNSAFLTAYRQKGRMSETMNTFQIKIVEGDFTALLGCQQASLSQFS
jgi:glucokinase